MNPEKKPHFPNWRTWVMTATLIIQLLTAIEYYHLRMILHDSASLQKLTLQIQIEYLKSLNQELKSFDNQQ